MKLTYRSEVPAEWPPLTELLDYQDKVRARVKALYDSEAYVENFKVRRALWLGFEHEGERAETTYATRQADRVAMHLETFLYMLLQSDKTLPPTSEMPDFEYMVQEADAFESSNDWVSIPATSMKVGMTDPEHIEGLDRYFGWDNEKPRREISVHEFESKAQPLSNEDYAVFMKQTRRTHIPASWLLLPPESAELLKNSKLSNGASANGESFPNDHIDFINGKYVRTVYGPVPLRFALKWPVNASYDELEACAAYMGGRIPTSEELQSIYQHAERLKIAEADGILSRKISAVNG